MIPNLIQGDILLSRNLGDNRTPGYWNHAAIYIGNNLIVEALYDKDAVVTTKLREWWDSCHEVVVMRYMGMQTHRVRKIAVYHAKQSVGKSYGFWSRIFWLWGRPKQGENCVSIVRKAYKEALDKDPRWVIPDDIYVSELFSKEAYKIER